MLRRLSFILLVALVSMPAGRASDEFFDSAGTKIHYVIEGEGEPVVLIHGFTASIPTQWGVPGVLDKLNKSYRVVAIEVRGHGRSDKPHDPKQYGAETVNDVLRLMDHLKIPKAHIVGYSMGGFMTNYLLATHPERFITATLGGAGWRRDDDPRANDVDAVAESLEAGKGLGPLIELLTPPGQPKPPPEQIQAMNTMLTLTNDPKALAACIRGMKTLSLSEAQLKPNKIPTLALIGSLDPLKEGVDELAKVMPNVKVEVIDGADHMTAFSQPKFAEALLAFLTAHSQVRSAQPAAAGAH